MDTMTGDENNLRDIRDTSLNLKDNSISIPPNKGQKLITALYMVTDIMDKDEPMRAKLRSLGLDILTDIQGLKDTNNAHSLEAFLSRIDSVLSHLSIGVTVGMISSMNGNILEKEFSKLRDIIRDSEVFQKPYRGQASLSDFLRDDEQPSVYHMSFNPSSGHIRHTPQSSGTRIGVQKASTLMQALSDKITPKIPEAQSIPKHREEFDLLKKERKDEIILIIKTKNLEQNSKGQALGVTITDIKSMAKTALKDTSEKTLQRELLSLIEEGVLKKTGEKRWSKYFLV